MAEIRDFDPDSIEDAASALLSFAEDIAKEALASDAKLSDYEKKEIILASATIRPAAEALIELISNLPLGPDNKNGFLSVLCSLIADSITVGSTSMYTKDGQAHLAAMRTALMQSKNSANGEERRAKIRTAILEAHKRSDLNGSIKFAESIQQEVCKKIGVQITEHGYSARNIQRVVDAILKECN